MLILIMQLALIILLCAIVAIWGVLAKKSSDNEIKTRKLTKEQNTKKIGYSVNRAIALLFMYFLFILKLIFRIFRLCFSKRLRL